MTSKEFRIVMTFSVTAFLFLFALIAFDVNIDLSPNQVQAATYTLRPNFTYTDTVPGLLSYQGTLADANGDPIDGNVEMTFRIYTTTLGGTPLYTETHPDVVVRAGDFAVLLGQTTPFPDGLFADPNRYLGLQVGAQAEMSPRQRFASVAFAMEAGNADTVDGVQASALTPLTHTHSLTCTPQLKYFEEFQAIPTNGAYDWEFFTISDTHYLAVANNRNNTTFNIDSKIYRWDGSSFLEFQTIPTNGAFDWEFFTISDTNYLAVANEYNGSTYNLDSKIYRWNGTEFGAFQTITTSGAYDWEFFTISDTHYLAVANHSNDSTFDLDSHIYRWDGDDFVLSQSIFTYAASDWKFFTIDNTSYLVVGNGMEGQDSQIYRWNGTEFGAFQSIASSSATTEWEVFKLGSDTYLAEARYYDAPSNYDTTSRIYRWGESNFVEFQVVPTSGARDWEFFTIGSDAYLGMANSINDSTSNNIDSKLYRWHGTRFVETQAVATHGNAEWEFFTIDDAVYLVIANSHNGVTPNLDSVIYRAKLEDCGTVGTPPSVQGE